MPNKDHLIIFDTTLRDGEQAAGRSLNTLEKLEIALQLEKLGVDIIEAGFPISSHGDFESVATIAKNIRNSSVCALARCIKTDIDRAWEAIQDAKNPILHIFLGISTIHLNDKLRKTPEEALAMIIECVTYAKKLCPTVEFSTEDAGRADRNYLARAIDEAIKAGATTINVPDSTGFTEPDEYVEIIKTLQEKVPSLSNVIISTHCHNDLGLAVANTLAVVKEGVRQVECTINGVGERAGNTALEEVVMAIKTRPERFPVTTSINTKELHKTSRLVSQLLNMPVQPNKAIVGKNAFAHSSGIHQDGVLKKRETYEIIDPKDVGVDESAIILSARSGKHALVHTLTTLGYSPSDDDIPRLYEAFKKLADAKKEVFDDDLHMLMRLDSKKDKAKGYSLVDLTVHSGTTLTPSAIVVLLDPKGKVITTTSEGTGPVDAAYSAVQNVIKKEVKLLEFLLKAVTAGIDAQAEVRVMIEHQGISYMGEGVHTDITVASTLAYLDALNQL